MTGIIIAFYVVVAITSGVIFASPPYLLGASTIGKSSPYRLGNPRGFGFTSIPRASNDMQDTCQQVRSLGASSAHYSPSLWPNPLPNS